MALLSNLLQRSIGNYLPLTTAVPMVISCRTYLDNFNNKSTAIPPPREYMHKDRMHFGYGRVYVNRIYLPRVSEVKRIRKLHWNSRMATEGGRMIIMRKKLRQKDILAHW